jgi:hypothetical protein
MKIADLHAREILDSRGNPLSKWTSSSKAARLAVPPARRLDR